MNYSLSFRQIWHSPKRQEERTYSPADRGPKARLYWKVLGYFGLLFLVLTGMTVLTMNFLAEIEKNFLVTSSDIKLLNSVEELRWFLRETPDAADAYLLTGVPSSRVFYQNATNEFDIAITKLSRALDDSTTIGSLKEVKELYRAWVDNIGDKKVALRMERRGAREIETSLASLTRHETERGYLQNARKILGDIFKKKLYSQELSNEFAQKLSSKIAAFIGMVNILLAGFALVLGFVLTRSITKPVRLLKEGTQRIMEGEFKPIALYRSDELGQLAADFNKMSLILGNNYARMKAYSDLVSTLNTLANLNNVEGKSLELLCRHTGASVGAIYILNKETNVLELAAGYALKGKGDQIKTFAIGDGIPGQCAAELRTLEINNLPAASKFALETGLVEITPRYVIALPLLFQDKLLGVLVLGAMHAFDELKKEIIHDSVPQIGVAITNAMNDEASQTLSIEIAKRNEELRSKNEELERAYRVKSDFLAGMSHELRTPLNSVIGFSSVLLSSKSDPMTAEQRMALEKILRNGKHLLELINDILDLSKIQAGRMTITIETDDVSSILSTTLLTVEPLARAKNLEITSNVTADVTKLTTDIVKLRQILVNLVSNAVKFTEEGEISVKVFSQNGLIAFAVKDSGIGIEKNNFEMIFEEFRQVEGRSAPKNRGTGLGLAISRRLARLLGGDLTVESDLGKGSTFTLAIPPVIPRHLAAGEPPQRVAPKPAPTQPMGTPIPVPMASGQTKILCIDDDPEVLEILRSYLIPEGYFVTGALSGDEGIRLAAELKPSLITLDIMMPHMDGWQVLRELKQNPSTKEIPVIMHSIIENRPLALSLGAVEVTTKPVDQQHLLALVRTYCKSNDRYVLIVDDNEDFASVLKKIMDANGIASKIANSGEQAMEILKKSTVPAIILLDLVMPGMDGFQVLREVRKNHRWKKIPVVIVSGKELTEQERSQLNNQISEYLRKSEFSQELISKTVKSILATKQP